MGQYGSQFIEIIFLLIAGVFAYWYTLHYVKVSSRQRMFLVGISAVFLAVVCGLILGAATNFSQSALMVAVFALAFGMMIGGLTGIIYADDAVKLWKQTRTQGKGGKWLVPNLPQRQYFIINGGLLFATGLILTIMAFFEVAQL